MKHSIASLVVLLVSWSASSAHFIWVVPEKDATKARVVFSDTLEADDGVAIEKIASLKLSVRDKAGKAAPVEMTKLDHSFAIRFADSAALVAAGTCQYGVIQKGQTKPYLLVYHPKMVRGSVTAVGPTEGLPLEIVAQPEGKFRVLFRGKPAAGSDVVALVPGGQEKCVANDAGEFSLKSAAEGIYGIRARHIEAKAGELEGKKYEETRHYATLVFEIAATKSTAAFPALPQAFSSFGAAMSEGNAYVYGGHIAETHTYSTEAVTGKFRRLNVANPSKGWEELPAGPGLQGLALVAVGGKIVRIGGMQPRNKPGDPADNVSIASCSAFDPKVGTWSALPDLPSARSSHDAVAVGDKIVVVGGWNMKGRGNKAEWHEKALVLDTAKSPPKWEAIDQPFARRALNVAALGTKVYVVGGMNSANDVEKCVDVLDLASGKWSKGPEIPGTNRNGFSPAACASADALFVSPSDGKIYRLADRGEAWTEIAELPTKRIVHRMVSVRRDLLLVMGGATREGNLAQVEAVCAMSPAATRP